MSITVVCAAIHSKDLAQDAASVVQESADIEKTREFWSAHDSSVSDDVKPTENNLSISYNQTNKSHALDRTDLVATPHHKMLLSDDLAFATPGTTSALVNDWCRSLQVKTRPVPREELNSEDVAADDCAGVLPAKAEEQAPCLAPERKEPLRSVNPVTLPSQEQVHKSMCLYMLAE